jgi:hypothetical protein
VKARAREEVPKLLRWIAQNAVPRYLFPACEIMQPLLEEDTARTRGKKTVILALRYFSAAAGDGQARALFQDLSCITLLSFTCGRTFSSLYTRMQV